MKDSCFWFTALAAIGGCACGLIYMRYRNNNEKEESSSKESSYVSLIGNTPLVKLEKLSEMIHRDIYVKMESLNPGGTGKDRAALFMVRKAIQQCNISKGCPIVEGTSGSTGIALASICNCLDFRLVVVMPDDQSQEKVRLLEALGASVNIVPSASISNPNHYVNKARKIAVELNGIFIDQFENEANFDAHYQTTGPEIWKQTSGKIDAFVMSSGTGGTISGVSRFLKSKNPKINVTLADPQGSSLHRYVKYGVCFTSEQSERTIKRHRYDSIVEGVGLDRITANFSKALIDNSISIKDQDIIEMAHWLVHNEGIFVGSSSALNICAAVQVAKDLPIGSTVVTIVCDSGYRHMSRFWNKDYVSSYGITWPERDVIPSSLKDL